MTENNREALARRILPHLRQACQARLHEWDAEREIEAVLGFEVDDLHERYHSICADIDRPEQALEAVTERDALAFFERIEGRRACRRRTGHQ